jgi:hypothetical protein
MEKEKITDADAADIYGIKTDHEKMPNGEQRFRLTFPDCNNYIRTICSSAGAWQIAHSHDTRRETYIVEKGWVAVAERLTNDLKIKILWPKDVITISPSTAHNVYLPASAVIHTVKHGSDAPNDWKEEPELTYATRGLIEKDILLKGAGGHASEQCADQRFKAYIALYNNLDNLIWRIPGFLSAGAAILIGFFGTVLSRGEVSKIPPILLSGLFFFIGLLFFLSAYSMARIREHHTMAGEWLAYMEPDGYFHDRRRTVKRKWPPSATLVFRWTFALLCVLFWTLSLSVFC